MPVRSVYVPGLREAFGFNLIDIILDHSIEPFQHRNDIKRNNIIFGTLDKSKNKIGINKGLEKEMDESKEKQRQMEKQREKESGGRAVHQTDVTCPEISVKPTETETKNTKPYLSGECSSKELSLRMTDSAGTSVKLQFHSMDQLNHVLQLLRSATSSTASQRTTVPILFKSVTVKSLFINSVTCLQATEVSKFAILECCDITANNVSIFVVLYCTVLYCTVLYCTVLYCTVLYCTVLYCTVLCCIGTVLCCTVLYRCLLYCTDASCTVLCCSLCLHISWRLFACICSLRSLLLRLHVCVYVLALHLASLIGHSYLVISFLYIPFSHLSSFYSIFSCHIFSIHSSPYLTSNFCM